MPALARTNFTARVVWMGTNPDREIGLASCPVDRLPMRFSGPPGESHAGLTRPSDSRVAAQHPKGTEIANVRQVSIVSQEDMDAIAADMGLACIGPEWLGATMMVEGLADFTLLPPSSRLQDEATGATLVIDMENRPCHLVSKVIEDEHPGIGRLFKAAARHRRGVTAWVEREGDIVLGASLRLHVPDQPAWPHLASALRS